MSRADESSYYEIALTNRQVLVAFVILLVCVVGAFFGGVWVGRGQPEIASTPSPAEGPAEVAAIGDDREQPAEFEFFTRKGERPEPTERPDLREIAADPDPSTTLAQDLGVEEQPAEPRDAGDVSSADNRTTAPEPVPTKTERRQSPPPPPPSSSPVGEEATPEDEGPLVIQVFSSRDEIQARRLLTRLQANGFEAVLSPVQVDAETMYRVRVGPFAERQQAEAVAARVRKELQVDTWITAQE